MKTVVHTIGHSTRTIEEFVALLQEYGIEMVIDVRRIARSRRNPHFNEDVLREALKRHSIEVEDILGSRASRPHKLTPFALVDGTTIIYPATA